MVNSKAYLSYKVINPKIIIYIVNKLELLLVKLNDIIKYY